MHMARVDTRSEAKSLAGKLPVPNKHFRFIYTSWVMTPTCYMPTCSVECTHHGLSDHCLNMNSFLFFVALAAVHVHLLNIKLTDIMLLTEERCKCLVRLWCGMPCYRAISLH